MLKDSFFRIEQIEKGESIYNFIVSIKPDHEIFRGHFPEQPVVPGVFEIQMIKECIEHVENKKYRYRELINCKFLNPIFPDNEVDFRIECNCEYHESFLLRAKVRSKNTLYLSLVAKLEEL